MLVTVPKDPKKPDLRPRCLGIDAVVGKRQFSPDGVV